MSKDEIKDTPSIKKLREDAEQFRYMRKFWLLLKPFAGMLGVDTQKLEEVLDQSIDLTIQVDDMTIIPDKFNDLFSDRGWILFDSMDLNIAKEAIEIAEKDGIETADEFLADYFSPDWVESRINWLKYAKGFQPRLEMAKKALDDYKAGRYYASVLVTLALIDGWVSELNIVNFQRNGFFSDKTQLIAWDSIAAHPKGLGKLKDVFGISRMMTRTERITVPYRHGIMHGMDLGYDNKFVAAKCWAALFAVRDWVLRFANGKLNPPELEPEKAKTLWESLENFQRIRQETEWLKEWQPRPIQIGVTIPSKGEPQDYPDGTPEQKLVEFLNYWLKINYGYMARCFAPMLQKRPVDVRESFQNAHIIEYELVEIKDVTAFVTDISVSIKLKKVDEVINSLWEFRLVNSNQEGKLANFPSEASIWGITVWSVK